MEVACPIAATPAPAYRADETGPHDDKDLYRERPLIEWTINQPKRFRRGATRSDTVASSYLVSVTFAMIVEWL